MVLLLELVWVGDEVPGNLLQEWYLLFVLSLHCILQFFSHALNRMSRKYYY